MEEQTTLCSCPKENGQRIDKFEGKLADPDCKEHGVKKEKKKWQMTKNTILQKCWVWNGDVTAFISKLILGYSLNVCAGKNPVCDVNLDLDPADKSILKGDMRLLPFKSNVFDTVISDPPWKISYYERFRPFFECVRVCKVGGRIVYNASWIPMCPSGDVELLETYIRQDANFTNASVISVFRKIKDNPEYEESIAHQKMQRGDFLDYPDRPIGKG